MFIGIGGFIHVIRLNLIRENYTLTFSGPEWQIPQGLVGSAITRIWLVPQPPGFHGKF